MQEVIQEKVSVVTIYNCATGLVMPKKIKWQTRVYEIISIGYHHKVKEGKKLFHIFSASSKNLAFRLKLDTDTLHWTLEEISDGLAN